MAKTLAERLDAVVTAFGPVRPQSEANGPAYRIVPYQGTGFRVEITNADGDRVAGTGTTVEEAIVALERKVNVTQE